MSGSKTHDADIFWMSAGGRMANSFAPRYRIPMDQFFNFKESVRSDAGCSEAFQVNYIQGVQEKLSFIPSQKELHRPVPSPVILSRYNYIRNIFSLTDLFPHFVTSPSLTSSFVIGSVIRSAFAGLLTWYAFLRLS